MYVYSVNMREKVYIKMGETYRSKKESSGRVFGHRARLNSENRSTILKDSTNREE